MIKWNGAWRQLMSKFPVQKLTEMLVKHLPLEETLESSLWSAQKTTNEVEKMMFRRGTIDLLEAGLGIDTIKLFIEIVRYEYYETVDTQSPHAWQKAFYEVISYAIDQDTDNVIKLFELCDIELLTKLCIVLGFVEETKDKREVIRALMEEILARGSLSILENMTQNFLLELSESIHLPVAKKNSKSTIARSIMSLAFKYLDNRPHIDANISYRQLHDLYKTWELRRACEDLNISSKGGKIALCNRLMLLFHADWKPIEHGTANGKKKRKYSEMTESDSGYASDENEDESPVQKKFKRVIPPTTVDKVNNNHPNEVIDIDVSETVLIIQQSTSTQPVTLFQDQSAYNNKAVSPNPINLQPAKEISTIPSRPTESVDRESLREKFSTYQVQANDIEIPFLKAKSQQVRTKLSPISNRKAIPQPTKTPVVPRWITEEFPLSEKQDKWQLIDGQERSVPSSPVQPETIVTISHFLTCKSVLSLLFIIVCIWAVGLIVAGSLSFCDSEEIGTILKVQTRHRTSYRNERLVKNRFCRGCPDHGYCAEGKLIACKSPYIIQTDRCVIAHTENETSCPNVSPLDFSHHTEHCAIQTNSSVS